MTAPKNQAEAIAYLKAQAAANDTLESLREAEVAAQAEKAAIDMGGGE